MNKFDLEDRLREFSANIIRLTDRLPNSRAGAHVANQLIRSGTSPYANHGEAQRIISKLTFNVLC